VGAWLSKQVRGKAWTSVGEGLTQAQGQCTAPVLQAVGELVGKGAGHGTTGEIRASKVHLPWF